MKSKLTSLAFMTAAMLPSAAASAAECEKVLSFSKLTSDTVYSSDDFEKAASDYCRGYSEAKQRANAGGGTVGYAGFTLGGSSSSARNSFTAEQVCKSSDAASVRREAYRTYVDSIAPGAFDAYSKCLSSALSVSFGEAAVLPKEASITVAFVPRSAGQVARLSAFGQGGAECNWYESADKKQIGGSVELRGPSTVLLACTRQADNQQSFVRIFDSNGDGSTALVLPWVAYKDGHPHSSFDDFDAKLRTLEAANSTLATRLDSLAALKTTLVVDPVGSGSGWNGPNGWRHCPDGQVLTSFMSGDNRDFRYRCATVTLKTQ